MKSEKVGKFNFYKIPKIHHFAFLLGDIDLYRSKMINDKKNWEI